MDILHGGMGDCLIRWNDGWMLSIPSMSNKPPEQGTLREIIDPFLTVYAALRGGFKRIRQCEGTSRWTEAKPPMD